MEFVKQIQDKLHGLYGLYDKKGRIYYVGRASDLPIRLKNHLTDKHAEEWESMTWFFLSDSANIKELEKLVIAIAQPKGNTQNKKRPNIGKDLKPDLERFLNKDSKSQHHQMLYPDKKQKSDKLSKRITIGRLKNLSQKRLANVLGLSQPRVSQLIHAKRGKALQKYIREGGHRDKILSLLEKQKK